MQCTSYAAAGFLRLPRLIDPDLAGRVARDAEALALDDAAALARRDPAVEAVDGLVWKWDPARDRCPELAALARDPRVLDAVRIAGVRDPVLFKDKLIVKPPGTRGSGLHQDYTWWQGFPTSLVTVAVAIDAADREHGCTEVYRGLHRRGLLHEPGFVGFLPDDAVAGHAAEAFACEPGDALVFGCFTPHRAGPNRGSRPRRQVFLTYNEAADGDHYAAYYDRLHGAARAAAGRSG